MPRRRASNPKTATGRTTPSERLFTAGLAKFFPAGRDVLVGIGDDAAVVRPRHKPLVLCCDPVVAGVHFEPDADLRQVGHKAVQRNLADLAAMGATGAYCLLSVILPRGMSAADRLRLFRGVRAAATREGCSVVGGDVAVGDGPLVVTVTAVGYCLGRPLQRSGAKVGDLLCVSGPLGGSIAGHHLRFRAPLREGQWLARQQGVHAAMDVSDGLLIDLQTMLAASGCPGAEIHTDAVPIRAAARRLAGGRPSEALRRALVDGEDHVLLWAQSDRPLASGGPLTARARRPIGRILATPGLWLVHRDGRRERLQPDGYQHALHG
jgi:thiamine-monophosphate kinase